MQCFCQDCLHNREKECTAPIAFINAQGVCASRALRDEPYLYPRAEAFGSSAYLLRDEPNRANAYQANKQPKITKD